MPVTPSFLHPFVICETLFVKRDCVKPREQVFLYSCNMLLKVTVDIAQRLHVEIIDQRFNFNKMINLPYVCVVMELHHMF